MAGNTVRLIFAGDGKDLDKTVARTEAEISGLATSARRSGSQLEQAMSGVGAALDEVGRDADRAATEVDKVGRAVVAVSSTDADIRIDTSGLRAARGDVDGLDRAVRDVDGRRAQVRVTADTSQAERELDGLGSQLESDGLDIGRELGGALAAGITAVLAPAIQAELENSLSEAVLANKLLGDPAAQEQAGKIAGQLYARGLGEGLGQVNDAVFAVMTSSAEMRDASQADIAAITESALTLSRTWGVDVAETMRAVGQLVRNDLVASTQEGLGLVQQAFQELGPQGQDALDTITEYSTQFRQLGIDGPTAMAMLGQAVEAGARDTDTAADALKEFAIIAQEGGKDAVKAFESLGLSASEMQHKISAGGPGAAAALDLVLERLRAVEDPAQRSALAVDLFGTKAEDLQGALFALDPTPTGEKFTNLASTMDQANRNISESSGTTWESVKRGMTDLDGIWAAFTGRLPEHVAQYAGGMEAMRGTMPPVLGTTLETTLGMVGAWADGATRSIGEAGRIPPGAQAALGPTYGVGRQAGLDLGEGFRSGIMAKVNEIGAAAQAAARAAVANIRSILQMRSPSRVGKGLGANLGDSFALGLDSVVGRIIASARDAAGAASAAMAAGAAPDRFAHLGGRVEHGQVSHDTWRALKAAGWRGRPGDGAEALYRPATPTPSAASAPAMVILEVHSSGGVDDLLAELIRRFVRIRGGNVQAVLGR